MAKKKQNKAQKLKNRSDTDLLRSAERAEAASRFKEAAEVFKELNKRHPGSYLDAFIRVQIQRYQVFVQNNMFESADQLLSNLKSMLPAEQLKALELRLVMASTDHESLKDVAWEAIKDRDALDNATSLQLLEALVFSDLEPPAEDSTSADAQAVLAVRAGFIALCAADKAAFEEALGKISRSSPLAHWKLVLRALDAWLVEDVELLAQCLQRLETVEGKAQRLVQALRALSGSDQALTAEALDFILGLLGSEPLADKVRKIDHEVAEGNILEAFKYASKQIPRLLERESDISEIIMDGFVRQFLQKSAPSSFVRHIISQLEDTRHTGRWLFPFWRVSYAHKLMDCSCFNCYMLMGKDYIQFLSKRMEFGDKKVAHICLHLAQTLLKDTELEDMELDKQQLVKCVGLLQDALEKDPQLFGAGLLTVECLLKLGDKSRAQKMLDALAHNFRDKPEVLLAAGKACIERKTYVRGLDFFHQAYHVSPDLPELKAVYAKGLLAYARQCYERELLKKARNSFTKMQPLLSEGSNDHNFEFGRRLMRLRQFELEASYGDISTLVAEVEKDWAGAETFRQAVAHLFTEQFGSPGRRAENAASMRQFFRQPALVNKLAPDAVSTLLALLNHHSNDAAAKRTTSFRRADDDCFEFITRYRMHFVPERLEGILVLIWRCDPYLIEPEELDKIVKVWSKADRKHPQLKLLKVITQYEKNTAPKKLLKQLEEALKEAQASGDRTALEKGEQLLKKIEARQQREEMFDNPGSFPHLPPGFFEDEFDDDEFDDDEFDEDEFDEDAFEKEMIPEVIERMYQDWAAMPANLRKRFESNAKEELGPEMANVIFKSFRQRKKFDRTQGASNNSNSSFIPF